MTSVILNQDDATATAGTYTYSSRPRAVPNRKQYRERYVNSVQPEGPVHYGNLMYDRRVVRGNTYAMQMLSWSPEPDPTEIQKRHEAHKKMLERKQAREESEVHAPEIEDPGSRINVQTELYLEEIADRVIEVDMECQTDAFIQRPPSPLFTPEKTGADVATQIEEGELFDFDIEVKPMLEVLVGKTLEQALLEIMEEEEFDDLRAHQCAYQEFRIAELAEVQRLEEQDRRHREEKERRKAQRYKRKENQAMVSKKVAAQGFAQQYLTDLIPSVFSNLRNKGFFYDEVQSDIEKGFLPYVMDCVRHVMEKKLLGRIMTDCFINEVTKNRLDTYNEYQISQSSLLHNMAEFHSPQDISIYDFKKSSVLRRPKIEQ
ncbi:radial spoke head protein 3 homolog [Python bivittatus]|uniref:Radial spoke head protein 3 homolog n=1 Tax=Python bivittatus TaxID=176946 RepID=A0A9F5IKJ3_PYTBI|nr:radial spoke head protein 3 homolog [Python bivittatus]